MIKKYLRKKKGINKEKKEGEGELSSQNLLPEKFKSLHVFLDQDIC